MTVLSGWADEVLCAFASRGRALQSFPGMLVAVLLLSAAGTWLAFTRMKRLATEAGPRIPPRQLILQILPLPRHSRVLLRYWRAPGRDRLRAQIYLDFRLIPAYVTLGVSAELLLALPLPGDVGGWWTARVSLAWMASGLLDFVENCFLLAVLSPTYGPGWQPGVFASAALKWSLVALGMLGVLWTGGLALCAALP